MLNFAVGLIFLQVADLLSCPKEDIKSRYEEHKRQL